MLQKGRLKKDTVDKKRNLNSEPQLNRRKVNQKVTSTKATSSCENDVEENIMPVATVDSRIWVTK